MQKVSLFLIFLSFFFLFSCTKNDDTLSNTHSLSSFTSTWSSIDTKVFEMDSFTKIENGKYFPQFSPKVIKVKKWDLVQIKLHTISWHHDFKIDELNVYAHPSTWSTEIIEFKADKAWEFIYWCTKPWHKENGHWGTLIVEE